MMIAKKTLKEYISLFLLCAFYLLTSMRYYPDRGLDTLLETLKHIATIGPFTIGATIIFASVFQKTAKERLPWKNVLRIFLTASILLEVFLGIAQYVSPS